MAKVYIGIVIGAVPPIVFLLITQYYLWARANKDLLLSKYERGIEVLHSELQTISGFIVVLKEPGEGVPYVYLRQLAREELDIFNNELTSIHKNYWYVHILKTYDRSLETIIDSHIDNRTNSLLKLIDASQEAVEQNQERKPLTPSLDLYKIFEKSSLELMFLLQQKVESKLNNPISRPLSWIWSRIKKPFT